MSFTSVIGRSLEKHERLLTLRPYLTVGLPLIGERLGERGVVWVEENQPRISSQLTALISFGNYTMALAGQGPFLPTPQGCYFFWESGNVWSQLLTAATPSYFGILFVHQQASALWQALAGGGAEATNVGRIAVAVCIVTSTILAFF